MSRSMSLRSVVLCEHINRGLGGQVNALGIFPNVVRCSVRPAFVQVMIYANFEAEHGEDVVLEIRSKGPKASGVGVVTIEGNATSFDIQIPLKGFVEQESKVTVDWRLQGEEWQHGATWPVRFSKDARELDEEDAGRLRNLFDTTVQAGDILNEVYARSAGPSSELIPTKRSDN
ncbi:MAG: hypothetical protein EOP06_07580 [Proteobacteria bacterium]|nr:MAG: hypothetical protein EOP06_07580 [Pseudomonadota bacterium]